MLKLDLLLLSEARRQLMRVENGNSQEPQEAETDEGVDLSADGHSELKWHCKRHPQSPQSDGRSAEFSAES